MGDAMSETLSDTTIVKAIKDQVSADLKDEAVILNLKNSVYYGLNPVGARIWQLIQEPTSVAALREKILAEYDVEPARCGQDVVTLLEALKTQGLIETSNPVTR